MANKSTIFVELHNAGGKELTLCIGEEKIQLLAEDAEHWIVIDVTKEQLADIATKIMAFMPE